MTEEEAKSSRVLKGQRGWREAAEILAGRERPNSEGNGENERIKVQKWGSKKKDRRRSTGKSKRKERWGSEPSVLVAFLKG